MKQGKRAAAGGVRVLLVEDNKDAAEGLQVLLETVGHRVCVVHDGAAGVAAARASAPDVIFVDIGLPGMDGYEVAKLVRAEKGLAHVVMVALTGHGRDEDRRQALAAGFDHHLVKPVNPDALLALVTGLPPASGTRTLH